MNIKTHTTLIKEMKIYTYLVLETSLKLNMVDRPKKKAIQK